MLLSNANPSSTVHQIPLQLPYSKTLLQQFFPHSYTLSIIFLSIKSFLTSYKQNNHLFHKKKQNKNVLGLIFHLGYWPIILRLLQQLSAVWSITWSTIPLLFPLTPFNLPFTATSPRKLLIHFIDHLLLAKPKEQFSVLTCLNLSAVNDSAVLLNTLSSLACFQDSTCPQDSSNLTLFSLQVPPLLPDFFRLARPGASGLGLLLSLYLCSLFWYCQSDFNNSQMVSIIHISLLNSTFISDCLLVTSACMLNRHLKTITSKIKLPVFPQLSNLLSHSLPHSSWV